MARGQGAALWADLHSSICESLRLATPLRPTGSAVRAFGAGFYPRPEGRGFHRASLTRGERLVGADSIFPTLRAMKLRVGWGTRLFEPDFYLRPKGRGFHRVSLARGEWFIGEDSIFPTPSLRSGRALRAMKLRVGWGGRRGNRRCFASLRAGYGASGRNPEMSNTRLHAISRIIAMCCFEVRND